MVGAANPPAPDRQTPVKVGLLETPADSIKWTRVDMSWPGVSCPRSGKHVHSLFGGSLEQKLGSLLFHVFWTVYYYGQAGRGKGTGPVPLLSISRILTRQHRLLGASPRSNGITREIYPSIYPILNKIQVDF